MTEEDGSLAKRAPFKENSIVRVQLSNFQNYTFVEFEPGPRLNLVLGPNGAGKSAIVNAIALALGADPKILGRGDKISSYVMNGKTEGHVEVELHVEDGPRMVIRRVMTKDNKSRYFLNGNSITAELLKKRLQKANIQVSNLCTFLPQDKVSSFSRFSPKELLVETERTVSQDLLDMHNKLIEMQENSEGRIMEEESLNTLVEQLRKESQNLEREVNRFHSFEEAKKRLALLKKKRLWVTFSRLQEEGRVLRDKKEAALRQLEEAKGRDEPLRQGEEDLAKALSKAEVVFKKVQKALAGSETERDKMEKNFETFLERLDECKVSLDNIERDRNKEEERVKKFDVEIRKLEEMIENFDEEAVKSKVEVAIAKLRDINAPSGALSAAQQVREGLRDERHVIMSEQREAQNRCTHARDGERRRHVQYTSNPQTKPYQQIRAWINQNVDKFRGQVFGPIALELNIRDTLSARCLELHAPNALLNGFVTTCAEDDRILSTYISKEMKRVMVNTYCIEGGHLRPLTQRKIPQHQFDDLKRQYGDMMLLEDAYEAPPAVMQVLRDYTSAHEIIVGYNSMAENIDDNLLLALTGGNGLVYACSGSHSTSAIQRWSVRLSAYTGNISSLCSTSNEAPRLVAAGVDFSELGEAEREFERCSSALKQLRERDEEVSNRLQHLQEKAERYKREKESSKKLIKEYRSNTEKLKGAMAKREKSKQKLLAGWEEQAESFKSKIANLLNFMMKEVVALASQQRSIQTLHIQLTAAEMEKEHIGVLHSIRKRRIEEAERNLRGLNSAVDAAAKDFKAAKIRVKQARLRADEDAPIEDEHGNELPLKHELAAININNLDELDEEISGAESQLRTHAVDGRVLEQYQQIQERLATEESKLQQIRDANEAADSNLLATKGPWLASLGHVVHALTQNFQSYMEDMGCAGEIRLDRRGSFKDYGLEIRVSFREKNAREKLQVLSANVHSGGECSVSTILFLMALQSCNRNTPFCVVDEINQGMDEVNERLAFSRIVRNSCDKQSGSQYFLMTPKLLQGLTAMEDANVTILVLFNGPWIPGGGGRDFLLREFAKKRRNCMSPRDSGSAKRR